MPNKVQVKNDSTKIRCESVNLLSSEFRQDKNESDKNYANIEFGVEIDLFEDRFISKLNINAKYLATTSENIKIGQCLSFCIAGVFISNEAILKQALIDFSELFSLSILWPYAREYASDVFRRAGYSYPLFPLINAQELTKQLIENKKIIINDLTETLLDTETTK